MSDFKKRVVHVIHSIPRGRVVSYGQVALYVGVPRGARQVGWILRATEEELSLPWWRVINNEGRISIKGHIHNTPALQRKLLESEGVIVLDDLTIDIGKYRWIPDTTTLKSFALEPEYIDMLHEKYFKSVKNR